MAEYYSNSISRKKHRTRKVYDGKALALKLLDVVASFAMVVLIFFTFVAISCQYISPERSGVLSVIALGAPVIYLLNIVVMFYWIVRWRWWRATAMIVAVAAGLFYVPRYYKLEIDRDYGTSYIERKYTKVMTYNVCEGKSEGLAQYIHKHNPDILCLQEMNIGTDNWNALADTYQTTYMPKTGTGGNQILSKFKIIRNGNIADLPRRNAVWADLKMKDDTIRVVSLHLQSTAISPEDTQFIEQHEYLLDNKYDGKFRSIISRLVENNCKRAVQTDVVADFLGKSPYKLIVCGDFNDVPLSYTYNCIAQNLDDTFSKMANGIAYTYNIKYHLLRIDNILVSPHLEVVSYEVDNEVDYSDHYPVISRVKF